MKFFQKSKKAINRLRKITWNGQRSYFVALFEESLSYLLRFEWFKKMAQVFVPVRRPENIVFLCGCFNSGTTILRDILGSHLTITKIPREGVVYTDHLSDYEVNEWARYWCDRNRIKLINSTDFSGLNADALLSDWRFWIPKKGWFLEKSIANLARMVELQSLFPEARFIIISREPLPVVEGITRRTKALVDEPLDNYSDTMAVEQWKVCKELVDEQIGLLNHCHELTYENFVAQPALEINKILEFMDLSAIASDTDSGLRLGRVNWDIKDGNAKSIASMNAARISEIKKELASDDL